MQSRGTEGFLTKQNSLGVYRELTVKGVIYINEVATLKAFSARNIRQHSTAAGGNAEASIPTATSIANSSPNPAIEEPHEQESDDVGDGSSLSCHGVQ